MSLEGMVVWIVGLPSSGKTTLAAEVVNDLKARDRAVLWLDSDDLRAVLTPHATYSLEERDWFYAAIGHIAARAAEGGTIVVVSATAPRRIYRDRVRRMVGHFIEVYLSANESVCRARDPKGLYRASETGEVKKLPGAGVPFEAPNSAELELDSGRLPPAALTDAVLRAIDAALDR